MHGPWSKVIMRRVGGKVPWTSAPTVMTGTRDVGLTSQLKEGCPGAMSGLDQCTCLVWETLASDSAV